MKGIRGKIILYHSLLILCMMLVLTYVSYRFAKENTVENVKEYVLKSVRETEDEILSQLGTVFRIEEAIQLNPAIRDYIIHSQENDYNKSVAKINVNKQLEGYVFSNSDFIKRISILTPKEYELYSSDLALDQKKLVNQEWFKSFVVGEEDEMLAVVKDTKSILSAYASDTYTPSIISCSVYNDLYSSNDLGYILIEFDREELQRVLESNLVSDKDSALIIDEHGNEVIHIGNIINNDFKEMPSDSVWEPTNNLLLFYAELEQLNWKLYYQVRTDHLMRKGDRLLYNLILIGGFGVIAGIIMAIIIAKRITKPLNQLMHAIASVGEGNFDVKMNYEKEDEISKVLKAFQKMSGKIKDLTNKLVNEERELRTAEIQVLQQQISPHFLYNTLNGIRWMAKMQKADHIAKSLTHLIKLLKSTVENMDQMITLQEEINIVESYMFIQGIRYGDVVHYECNIEDELLGIEIPKLSLLTLVENCYNHGFTLDMSGDNRLTISGESRNGEIIISVEDNGRGAEKFVKGIGLNNIEKRLELTLGVGSGLQIVTAPNEGSKVFINIPIQETDLNEKVQ